MILDIIKTVYGGFGMGRDLNNRPIFVKKTIPGDKVKIELTKINKSYSIGVIKKIINPSPIRINAKCPHFDECGGCNHQNISYQNQLKIKDEIFKEVLSRTNIDITPESIIAGSNHPFYYRNSIRFFFLKGENGEIAFARHHYLKKNLVEIEGCLLQSAISNQVLDTLKSYINRNIIEKSSFWQIKIREGELTGDMMIEIITTSCDLPGREGIVKELKNIKGIKSIYHTIAYAKSLKNLKRKLIFGSPIIYEKIGRYKFQISPESFFQTNSYGAKTLYDIIKDFSDIKTGDSVLDLFCGIGTISIYLSTLARDVLGIDIVPEAIRDANDNLKINKIKNCQFISLDINNINNNTVQQFNNIVVLDPPRAGLNKDLIKKISDLKFDRLIYASCNPATFARDINEFKKNHIILKKVQPIDNFPQTHHIECVGLLEKK